MAFSIDFQPQFFTPVYNPVVFGFSSTNFQAEGFRYRIQVIDTKRNTVLGNFKIVPQQNGTGYLDIQKILSNSVSLDFTATTANYGDATNSYINYGIVPGEEFTSIFPFHQISPATGTVYSQYVKLRTTGATTNLFTTGDQISVTSSATTPNDIINGLHSVLSANATEVIIDVIAPGTLTSQIALSGTVRYADNRKVITTLSAQTTSGFTAFNGGLDWDYWKEWSNGFYYVSTATTGSNATFLLTSLNEIDYSKKDNRVYLTQTQELWLNYFMTQPQENLLLNVRYFEGGVALSSNSLAVNNGTTGNVKSFKVGFTHAGIVPNNNGLEKWMDVSLVRATSPFPNVSKIYRFYLDERCKRNEYEILFLDRWGSRLSIPLQLKDTEVSKIERVTSKKVVLYTTPSGYDLTSRGSDISNVDYEKTITLTSNWMNDSQMKLFDEMLSSPYTFLRKNFYNFENSATTLQYYSCIVKDGGTEIVKQKNKRIFNKTVQVVLANNRPINI